MKKLFAIMTVLALTVVLCLGSFAQMNLDRLYVDANVLDSSTSLAGESIITIDPGQKIYILGWAVKAGTNLEKVYYKLNGEAKECDGTDSYLPRADVAGVLGVDAAYAQSSSVGANTAMMELIGIDSLANGKYTVDIIAKYQDSTEEVGKSFTLQVGPATDKSYGLVPGAGAPTHWLVNDGDFAAVEFTSTIAFTQVSVPNTWASRQDDNRPATVVLSLYKFQYNSDYTLAQAPIATTTYTTVGDNIPGCILELDEAAPAGTYIFEVKTVGELMTGDVQAGSAYFVLDKAPDTFAVDESLFKYFGKGPFMFSIYGEVTQNDPVTANPADTDAPTVNPPSADASMVIFVVAAAAIALVVLKKKVF